MQNEQRIHAVKMADGYHGFTQECRHGDAAGAHSVYCQNDAAPCRKCRHGWYTWGHDQDNGCEWFEKNPHWVSVGDQKEKNYDASRDATFAAMLEAGVAEDASGDDDGDFFPVQIFGVQSCDKPGEATNG